MKKFISLLFLFLCLWGSSAYCATDSAKADKVKLQAEYGRLPLSFIKNQGQVDEQVLYYLKGREGTIYFTKKGIVYDLVKKEDVGARQASPDDAGASENNDANVGAPLAAPNNRKSDVGAPLAAPKDQKHSRLSFTLKPEGANQNVQIVPQDELPGKINSFIGNDPQKWHSNITTYKSIVYQNLYPGIDLKVYGTNRQMEYDFIVHPGADPKTISLAGEGVDGLETDADGNLIIKNQLSDIKHLNPVIYQEISGKRVKVDGSFTIANNRIGFDVKNYNKDYPLTIDPLTLTYSTYLGGTGIDQGQAIAVDSAGCAYGAGYTKSSAFPTVNAYDNSYNSNTDAFVTKFSATGNTLVFSTYLGGTATDEGYGIAIDSSGCAYLTGQTGSSNFPVATPYQATRSGSEDVFITKLSADGATLVYSTFLGGTSHDDGYGIAVDTAGCAYVTGKTYSANFPSVNPYQSTNSGNWDAFAAKLSASGNALVLLYLSGRRNNRLWVWNCG